MNIFYFTSDLFTSVAATSIVSLLENNKHFKEINFYIVDDGITNENKKALTSMIEKYKRRICFIPAPDPVKIFDFPFKNKYQLGHSYPRMCIGQLLPKTVEKVLCLDSDTLILGNLDELWNIDMGENILAGVVDCMNLKAYKKQFQLLTDELYCNAGVFLVNVKRWREEKIEEKINKVIKERNGNIFFFEQTLMNYCCRRKIMMLHPKYNCYTLFWAFNFDELMTWRKPTIFYTQEQVIEAKRHPVIIHFTRNFYMLSRPWVKGCDHPMSNEYLKYKKMTPWKELEDDDRSIAQKRRFKLWHIIPKKALMQIVSIIYNEVRPKIWWKNE